MTTPAGMKACPFCAEPIQAAAIKCRHCASHLEQPPAGGAEPSGVQTLIPLSNPAALMAYYCAVFSIIPVFGLLLGPVALALGIVGRSKVKSDPRLPGTAHAWIGILLGGAVSLCYAALVVLAFAA